MPRHLESSVKVSGRAVRPEHRRMPFDLLVMSKSACRAMIEDLD